MSLVGRHDDRAPQAGRDGGVGSTDALVVVMGVSGCGKTTVGRLLADALGVEFVEGDDLHSPRNVARMAAGIALTDSDRQDWLQALAERIGAAHRGGSGLVVACSALKSAYRDRLRSQAAELAFVHLRGSPDLLAQRLAARKGHYMPPSLLSSQLATLEAPAPDERALTLEITLPAHELARAAKAWLESATSHSAGRQSGQQPTAA
jgi:carbohydrate kinase (thermoresistant glucokinase family)